MKRIREKSATMLILLAIAAAGFFFLRSTGLLSAVRSPLLAITQPISGVMYSLGGGIASFFRHSSDVTLLQDENERLRDEIVVLKTSLAQLESAKQENQELRQLLDFFESETNTVPQTIARVTGKDPANLSILLLNAGLRDGVEVGNAVVVDDGVMVAKIIEVYAKSSKALLLTDGRSKVAVTISGGLPTNKIAHGERGLSLVLDQIPQGEQIKEGQLVISSGLEASIPRGLVVGEIEEIISQPNDLFQTAILRPLVNYEETYFVSVILSPTTS